MGKTGYQLLQQMQVQLDALAQRVSKLEQASPKPVPTPPQPAEAEEDPFDEFDKQVG